MPDQFSANPFSANTVAAPTALHQRLLSGALRRTLRTLMKPLFHPRVPVSAMRAGLRALSSAMPSAAGVRFQPLMLGRVPGECADPSEHNDQAVLYLHGGAYLVGSPATHRNITSHLARAANACVYAIDYRLAPEHPFPAALDDVVDAFQWLLQNGYRADQITLAGDSAGGGLALATAVRLGNEGKPMPKGLLLLSPWADLGNPMAEQPITVDEIMLNWHMLQQAAQRYAPDQLDHQYVSPLSADLAGLPPTLIIVGDQEILLSDSERLLAGMQQAGSPVELYLFAGMWHVFVAHAGLLSNANLAIRLMAERVAAGSTETG